MEKPHTSAISKVEGTFLEVKFFLKKVNYIDIKIIMKLYFVLKRFKVIDTCIPNFLIILK